MPETISFPPSPRARIKDSVVGLDIRIPGRRDPVAIFVILLWSSIWFTAPVREGPSMRPWIPFWGLGCLWAFVALLRLLFQQERIRLHHGVMTIRRSILGLGFTHTYDGTTIRNLRVMESARWPWYLYFTGATFLEHNNGSIAFDNGFSTIRFAANVGPAEATALVNRLSTHLGR
jgi:hypothetical protein